MRRGYADTPEGQVHYVTEGFGYPLLLIHNSPRSWTTYRRLIPLLSGKCRVIAMDTLGFGNSDPAPASYEQIGDYADNVAHFLASMGIAKADIWGTFTGSHIAAEVAITWPERVRRLVLLGVPIFLSAEEQQGHIEKSKSEMPRFAPDTDGRYLMKILELAVVKKGPGNKTEDDSYVDFQYVNDWIAETVKAGPAFDAMALRVYSYQGQARLPLIKSPTLVFGLAGQETPCPFHTAGDRANVVQTLIPNSRLVMLHGPGADREVYNKRAEDLARPVLSFLGAEST